MEMKILQRLLLALVLVATLIWGMVLDTYVFFFISVIVSAFIEIIWMWHSQRMGEMQEKQRQSEMLQMLNEFENKIQTIDEFVEGMKSMDYEAKVINRKVMYRGKVNRNHYFNVSEINGHMYLSIYDDETGIETYHLK